MAEKSIHIVDLKTADSITGEEYLVLQDAGGITYTPVTVAEAPSFEAGKYFQAQSDGTYIALETCPDNWQTMYNQCYTRTIPDTQKVPVKLIAGKAGAEIKTAAEWESENPVLSKGQIGVESDTNKLKIGDGNTAWSSLLYKPGTSTEDGGEIFNSYKDDEGSGIYKNIAGEYAHAEGQSTKATGTASHAEGNQTTAEGGNSHAEGYRTVAREVDAHAEGNQTYAFGEGSHAEGYYTKSYSKGSHVEGFLSAAGQRGYLVDAQVSATKTYVIDAATIDSNFAVGTKVSLYDRTTRKNYVNFATITAVDATNNIITVDKFQECTEGDALLYLDGGPSIGEETVWGEYAHAEGSSTKADGNSSHAEGENSQSWGRSSHAEGSMTKAIGSYSHAEGQSTQAAGNNSHAEGTGTQALSASSHAEGSNTKTLALTSHAEGYKTEASGKYSHAEGNSSKTGAYGYEVKAKDQNAHTYTLTSVEGLNTSDILALVLVRKVGKAFYELHYISIEAIDKDNNIITVSSADYKTWAGAYIGYIINTTTPISSGDSDATQLLMGQNAHAEGEQSFAIGNHSHAENASSAVGLTSHAEGQITSAIGEASHTEGEGTMTFGKAAHAEGAYTLTNSMGAHAEGRNTQAGATGYKITAISDDGFTITLEKADEAITADSYCAIKLGAFNYYHVKITGADIKKNILPYPYTETTKTVSGITFTDNGNGTITINGTATTSVPFQLCSTNIFEAGKKYTIYGGVTGAKIHVVINGVSYSDAIDLSSISEITSYSPVLIGVDVGATFENVTIKPQVVGGTNEVTVDAEILPILDSGVSSDFEPTNYLILEDSAGSHFMSTGPDSHAEGRQSIAYAIASHAEGDNTRAMGDNSHAEGEETLAGNDAHAEGALSKALGWASHAEGNSTEARGEVSHAEGNQTKAIGSHSHAEGERSEAQGNESHAEGATTKAIGHYSHSEGSMTTANGDYSHAEGRNSKTIGAESHAEGYNTTAEGMRSHAEGDGSYSQGKFSHAEGSTTKAMSESSHAEGRASHARSIASHTEGVGAKTGVLIYSVVSMNEDAKSYVLDTVSGLLANMTIYVYVSDNINTSQPCVIQSVDTDTKTIVLNTYVDASAFFVSNFSSGNPTKLDSTKDGIGAHAEGGATIAAANFSHAEGQSTIALGSASHAEGKGSTASGKHSHAEGYATESGGIYSHAEGNEATSKGESSHAEGYKTVAISKYSHAEGREAAAGSRGYKITAKDASAKTYTFEGMDQDFDGYSVAIAVCNTHRTIWTILDVTNVDYQTKTITVSSFKDFDIDNVSAYIVDLMDASKGDSDIPSEGAHAEGVSTYALGQYSHAEGYSMTLGQYSHAEGLESIAGGDNSHAEGERCETYENSSHAEGYKTTARAYYVHAEGETTHANMIASHAEGSNTTAGQMAYTVLSKDAAAKTYTLKSIEGLAVNDVVSMADTFTDSIDTYTGISIIHSLFNSNIDFGKITAIDTDTNTVTVDTFVDYEDTRTGFLYVIKKPNIGDRAIYGYGAHAEGSGAVALGNASHAEGGGTAIGIEAHAEGNGKAYGSYSHAEGNSTAKGQYAHAEGSSTATGECSHAEGYDTTASGNYSHAEGRKTTAAGAYQHVEGIMNITDTENRYLHIVGNGKFPKKYSNAHTLDKQGNAWYKGDVRVGGTSYDDAYELAIKIKAIPHTTASGTDSVSITDFLNNEEVINYKIYGNSIQNGTPSTESPVEIQSVGDLVTDTTSEYYGKYKIILSGCEQEIPIYLNAPLRQRGNVADYIDFENQQVVRMIEVVDDTGTKTIDESFSVLSTPTSETLSLGSLVILSGSVRVTVSVGSATAPSQFDLTYFQDINKVIAELKNALTQN